MTSACRPAFVLQFHDPLAWCAAYSERKMLPLCLKLLWPHAQNFGITRCSKTCGKTCSETCSKTQCLDFTSLNACFLTFAWCEGEDAAQVVSDTTVNPVAPLQPADMGQAQASDKVLAPQSQPEQPVASQSQELEAATVSAADSTADTGAFSSDGGGRYMSVPPSSLWGPPVDAGVTTSSAAAQPAEAERQQLASTGGNMPGDVGRGEHGRQEQSIPLQQTSHPPAVEHGKLETHATDQQPAGEHESTAETEADLLRAQQAQREALQAEGVALQSNHETPVEVREAGQQEQAGPVFQDQDQVTLSSMAQTDTGGRPGGDLPPVQEADRQAEDSVLETGAVSSGEQAFDEGQGTEADESVAQTETALADAQEAQQHAVQAGQEALAEERRDLMQLRQDVQQQSGQSAQLCATAVLV